MIVLQLCIPVSLVLTASLCFHRLFALQLVMNKVGIMYENPSLLDTCEQYNQKVLYGLQQQYGSRSIAVINDTAGRLIGPITIPVLALDGRHDGTTGTDNSNLTGECIEVSQVPASTL